LVLSMAAPVSADDGCGRALAATAGTPGHVFVAAHCATQSTAPVITPVTPVAGAAAAGQGCALGLAAATGTPGEPFVRAACNQLASQLEMPALAPVPLPTADNGCAIAELMTRGTPGHPWVETNCGQSAVDTGTAATAQSLAAGCELAI